MNATRFWNGTFVDFVRLSTGVISLPAMFLNNSVYFLNHLFLFCMHLLQCVFFDNCLLPSPGCQQLATELLHNFLIIMQNHFEQFFVINFINLLMGWYIDV
jgi:hypothetical protein